MVSIILVCVQRSNANSASSQAVEPMQFSYRAASVLQACTICDWLTKKRWQHDLNCMATAVRCVGEREKLKDIGMLV